MKPTLALALTFFALRATLLSAQNKPKPVAKEDLHV